MNLKIGSVIVAAIAGAIGSVVVVGAAGVVAYKKKASFKKMVDEKLYPQFKQIVKENGAFAVRSIIEVALVNFPVVKVIFLNIVNAVEAGKVKLPKNIEKELFNIKEELPSVFKVLNQNALALE